MGDHFIIVYGQKIPKVFGEFSEQQADQNRQTFLVKISGFFIN